LQVIDFELPITVKLTVVDVDPGVKGDTAQGNILGLSEILRVPGISYYLFLNILSKSYHLLEVVG